MFKQYRSFQYYLLAGVCAALIVFPAIAEPAEGDGEPDEIVIEDQSSDLYLDEQGETAENAVATLTADGDFLLPTYLLPGETATVTRQTVVEEVIESPAIQTAVIRTKNVQSTEPSKTIKREAVKAPVVPAEQDILAEVQAENALPQPKTPQPVKIGTGHKIAATQPKEEIVTSTEVSVVTEPVAQDAPEVVARAEAEEVITPVLVESIVETTERGDQKLLVPLAPIVAIAEEDGRVPEHKRAIAPSAYADQILDSLERQEPMAFLMPRDLKLSFYPNDSAFSGSALKWVKAFAVAALNDPRLIVEVRTSCHRPELQKKRLKLVESALRETGLSTHQIVVTKSKRNGDTMLLRAIPKPEPKEIVSNNKGARMPKGKAQVTKW